LSWVVALVMTAATVAGCASLRTCLSPGENISKKRRQRSEEAIYEFGRQRDLAEFEGARRYREQGDLDGCIGTLRRLVARNPDHLDARLLLAESLLADDRAGEAIPYLEPAVAAHPDDPRAHYLMGLALDSMGNRADALVYYREATRLRPNDEVYAVSYQTLAASLGAGRSVLGALSPDSQPPVRSPKPRSSAPAQPQVSEGEGEVRSIAFWESEDSRRSTSASSGPGSGSGAFAADRNGPAAATARRGQEVEPQPAASICFLAPETRKRTVAPPIALQDDSSSSGPVAWASDDPAWPQDPKRFVPRQGRVGYVGAAGSDGGNGRGGRAVDDPAAELFEKGASAMSNGTDALGFAYFREAMALKPDDPHIPVSSAISALRQNEPDVAVALLEPLLQAPGYSDSAAIRRILGAAYYRLGDYDSSQVVLQQALSLDKSSALSYFLMGCTLAKLGQLSAAETHFRQAQRLDPRYAVRR
jgi:tetratricopeptide (TPR) repeat protein